MSDRGNQRPRMLLLAGTLIAVFATAAPALAQRSPPAAAPPAAVDDWPPDPASDEFRPDVYPSERLALRAAGRAAAALVAELGRGVDAAAAGGTRTVVVHTPDSPGVDNPQWRPATEALQDALPPEVRVEGKAARRPAVGRPPAGEAWVSFDRRADPHQHYAWSPTPLAAGRIEVYVGGPAASRSVEVRYETKPWVEDPARFASAQPRGQQERWIVGRSRRPAATRQEAEQLALEDAAAQLSDRADRRAGVARSYPSGVSPHYGHALSTLSQRYVSDRTARRFARTYGDVWDAAVLVDASNNAVGRVASAAWDAQTDRRDRGRITSWSSISMAGVIGILYLVVNAVTKGYFTRRLRVVAALLMLGGIFAAVRAMRTMG